MANAFRKSNDSVSVNTPKYAFPRYSTVENSRVDTHFVRRFDE